MIDGLIVDASAVVDVLIGSPSADAIQSRLRGHSLHAPAHFDAEILSALGRLHRGKYLTARQTTTRILRVADSPIQRHHLPPLLEGAWKRRHNLRLVDALYAELATQLDLPLITTDGGLASAYSGAELVSSGDSSLDR